MNLRTKPENISTFRLISSSAWKPICIPIYSQFWVRFFSRGISHWTGLENRSKNSVLHHHSTEVHGGPSHQLHPKDFVMSVVQSHRSNLSRQVQEGTIISGQLAARDRERKLKIEQPRQILNSKTEFNQPGTVQPRASKILY